MDKLFVAVRALAYAVLWTIGGILLGVLIAECTSNVYDSLPGETQRCISSPWGGK